MSKNYLIFLFLIVLIVAWVAQGLYLPFSGKADSQQFRVKSGQGVFEISQDLKEKELIKSDLWFNVYYLLNGKDETLKAGSYSLSGAMSVAEIFEKISNGETNFDKITITEGWSIRDIGNQLEKKDWYQPEEFYEVVGYPVSYGNQIDFKLSDSFEKEYDFLESKPDELRLEGYLFPDTYHLSEQSEPQVLVKKMLDNFESRISSLKIRERSVFEIVTMASLLEKEVRTSKDKKIVAGILWKRLENGMPLQVDATISYITGRNTTKVSKNETEIDSPYNTYKYRGLPKGPICNPGLSSIKAALNPIATDYWYYLSVPEGSCPRCSEGGTYFSETLRQHNIGKVRYLSN